MPLPLDYTSVDEVRREFLTQLSTAEQPALAKVITFASRAIDRRTNRYFYTTTGDETRNFDGFRRDTTTPYLGYRISGARTFDPGVDVISVTTLNLAANSAAAASGTLTSIAAADFFLQPAYRMDGWPARYIELIEEPTGSYPNSSQPFLYFQPGLRTVQIIGKFGWNTTTVESTAFPQEIRLVAIEMTAKLWRSRDAGYSGTIGVSELGVATVDRVLSPWARDVLDAYSRPNVR